MSRGDTTRSGTNCRTPDQVRQRVSEPLFRVTPELQHLAYRDRTSRCSNTCTVASAATRGIGGRVTEVRIRAAQLDDGVPVACRDTMTVFELVIDFGQPSADIVAAIQAVLQDGVDNRWTRHPSTEKRPDPDGGPTSE